MTDRDWWIALGLVALLVGMAIVTPHADASFTLRGRLTASESDADDGSFVLETDDGAMSLNPGGLYSLHDYLMASVGHRFTIMLVPDGR